MSYDVAVAGAGVFGAWIAYKLTRDGAKVLLLDAYGPGNSRASSGGESRLMRLGYGPDEIYTRSAQRSFHLWQNFFAQLDYAAPLFHRTGVLWPARDHDPYCEATLATLQAIGANYERLERAELSERFPQLRFENVTWGILEVDAGALMARRAVQAVAAKSGADYLPEAIVPPPAGQNRLDFVQTTTGTHIAAAQFVFACGPWLPKVFPKLLGELIYVTRQEVFFIGVPPGNDLFQPAHMPAWVDFSELIYGLPNLEGRGFKIAIDAHGPQFDPDEGERIVSPETTSRVRQYLAQRIPLLANAPVIETRVCQYENTSNGDLLMDRHPDYENVWLVGGGSGHGFKHGPAAAEYVAAMIAGKGEREPRFGLATKERVQHRKVF